MQKQDHCKKATLRDASKAAELTLATDLRALRGLDFVHPDTHAKALQTIEDNDNTPNFAAGPLVHQCSVLIEIIAPVLACSLLANFAEGVSKILESCGLRMPLAGRKIGEQTTRQLVNRPNEDQLSSNVKNVGYNFPICTST